MTLKPQETAVNLFLFTHILLSARTIEQIGEIRIAILYNNHIRKCHMHDE